MIKQGLLTPSALKAYHSWICNETYPDLEKQETEAQRVEQQWPTFKQDVELGRIPNFLWQSSNTAHMLTNSFEESVLQQDAEAWLAQYNRAAQYRMERVQQHIQTASRWDPPASASMHSAFATWLLQA